MPLSNETLISYYRMWERENQRVLFTRETDVDQYHVDNYVKGTLELETRGT